MPVYGIFRLGEYPSSIFCEPVVDCPASMNQVGMDLCGEVLDPRPTTRDADTPLFWSGWERRGMGLIPQPMTGKNIWQLCKVYGRMIGTPTLKPHDVRHGVAMEVYEPHHDLEKVRALLGRARLDTTQVYARIRRYT